MLLQLTNYLFGLIAGVPIVKHKEGADPAAVVYDAMEAAKARNADLVIVDTAGRLHTKVNLMEELKRWGVANNHVEGAPHQTLLVLDVVLRSKCSKPS